MEDAGYEVYKTSTLGDAFPITFHSSSPLSFSIKFKVPLRMLKAISV